MVAALVQRPRLMSIDRRRATRIQVCIPATIEVLAGLPAHGGLDTGYERLVVPPELAGSRFEGTILDLSSDGARLSASNLPPLLSRLSVHFTLPDYGDTLAVCVVMWRRAPSAAPAPSPDEPQGASGFGVLFEVVDLGVRKCIADMVNRAPPQP
jgi:hypothetical protein